MASPLTLPPISIAHVSQVTKYRRNMACNFDCSSHLAPFSTSAFAECVWGDHLLYAWATSRCFFLLSFHSVTISWSSIFTQSKLSKLHSFFQSLHEMNSYHALPLRLLLVPSNAPLSSTECTNLHDRDRQMTNEVIIGKRRAIDLQLFYVPSLYTLY
jgi:hypothetical protein